MKIQEAINRLRTRTHVPMFANGVWDTDLGRRLRETELDELFDNPIADAGMAACVLAGLHLWNDDFPASHNLCQGIHTVEGSYWHGLGHRREGHQGEGLDANLRNAKYWFRRVGEHPAYDLVYRSALEVLDTTGSGFRWATEAAATLRSAGHWDPNLLIDWFGQADRGVLSPQTQAILEEIQWREIDLLVDWCQVKALGG